VLDHFEFFFFFVVRTNDRNRTIEPTPNMLDYVHIYNPASMMQQKARDKIREESMWMQEYAREKKTARKVCGVMQMCEYHCSFYISRSGGYNIEPENVFFFCRILATMSFDWFIEK
jgi:hypothetical protein